MYEGFRVDDFFKSFKWVISIGREMPYYMQSQDNPLAVKNYSPVHTLTYGRLMTGTLDIARFLDDNGCDAMQDGFLFGISQFASELAGWNKAGQANVAVQSIICDAPLKSLTLKIPCPFDNFRTEAELLNLKRGHLANIDLLGTASLNVLSLSAQDELKKIMPEARSLIVAGTELPARVVELAGKQEAECAVSYQYVNYQALREAFGTAHDIASSLTAMGHKAIPLFEIDSVSKGQKTPYVSILPDLRSQAPFAASAGLGFVGKNGFLISEKFGPRQRFAFVLSSAELKPDTPISGRCPENCRACIDACPVNALTEDKKRNTVFERNEDRCEWARVLGMVEGEGTALAGWKLPDIPVPDKLDDVAREQALKSKDPIQTLCYKKPNNGDTQVERCLQACPLAKPRRRHK